MSSKTSNEDSTFSLEDDRASRENRYLDIFNMLEKLNDKGWDSLTRNDLEGEILYGNRMDSSFREFAGKSLEIIPNLLTTEEKKATEENNNSLDIITALARIKLELKKKACELEVFQPLSPRSHSETYSRMRDFIFSNLTYEQAMKTAEMMSLEKSLSLSPENSKFCLENKYFDIFKILKKLNDKGWDSLKRSDFYGEDVCKDCIVESFYAVANKIPKNIPNLLTAKEKKIIEEGNAFEIIGTLSRIESRLKEKVSELEILPPPCSKSEIRDSIFSSIKEGSNHLSENQHGKRPVSDTQPHPISIPGKQPVDSKSTMFLKTSQKDWDKFKAKDQAVYKLVKKYDQKMELDASDFDGVYENRLNRLCRTYLINEDQGMVEEMKWDLIEKAKELSVWEEFSPRTQFFKNKNRFDGIANEINAALEKLNQQADKAGKSAIQALNKALKEAKDKLGSKASTITVSLDEAARQFQESLGDVASKQEVQFLLRDMKEIIRQSEIVSEKKARDTAIRTIQESIPNIVKELIKKINPELEKLESKVEELNSNSTVEREKIKSCIDKIKDDLKEVSFRITANKESNDRFMLQLHRDVCQLYESDKNIFNELDQKIKDIARSMSDFFSSELIEDLRKQRERTEEKEAELYSLNDSPRGLIFHDVFKGQLRALREGALASTSDAVKLSGRKASTAANVIDTGAEILGAGAKIASGIDVSGSASKVITTPIKMKDEHSQKTSHVKRIIGSMRLLTDENIDRFSRKIPLRLRNGAPINLDTMQPPKRSDVKKFVSTVVHYVTNKHALKRLSTNEQEYWFIKIAINTAEELFKKLSEINMGSEFNPNEEERLFNEYLDHAIQFARNKIELGKWK